MIKAFQRILAPTGVAVIGAAALLATGAAQAQQQRPAQQWAKICSKAGENDICNVQYTLVTQQGQMITSVNLLTA